MLTIIKGQPDDASAVLRHSILGLLRENKPVLFLVSGGSTVPIANEVFRCLAHSDVSRQTMKLLLDVSLVDERFGPEGHADSNWHFLSDSGMDTDNFTAFPVLSQCRGEPDELAGTTAAFNAFLGTAVDKRTHGKLSIIALFGIGEDGHTAGILPESPAASLDSAGFFATGYKSALFTRITMAPAFFNHIDLAVVWAAGEKKRGVIRDLSRDIDPIKQPAQFLKRPAKTVIYTDQNPGDR